QAVRGSDQKRNENRIVFSSLPAKRSHTSDEENQTPEGRTYNQQPNRKNCYFATIGVRFAFSRHAGG
ncbi:MAG TPA: hypothetical protein PK543_02080, partial [Candidatus Saccharibacteria bacterium]|nr:hypothetical protein [Candidatus Saccharibacteria bacterium]